MNILNTSLKDVKLISISAFEDYRGQYVEIYNKQQYSASLGIEFVEDDISVSNKHILRGIHGDDRTWKLVSCLYGKFYLVVVNCDKKSNEFGEWCSFTLSDVNRSQVLIPPNYGNAHLVLSDTAIFHYKQSEYYNRDRQFTYKWNDPLFDIWWPINNPILSQRDDLAR